MSEESPNLPNQAQPPDSNYGYQAYDQPQAYPRYNPQPNYIVPSTTDNNINAPNRWRRWVGYNALAFSLSCVIMPLGCGIMALIVNVLRSGLQELPDSPIFNMAGLGAISALLITPIFLTMASVSMIQRSALYHQVPIRSWFFGSSLSGIGALFLSILVMGLIAAQINPDFTPKAYIFSIFGIFAGISTGIGFFQWWQLRKIMLNAWHWPLIAGATWTSLGTLIVGFGMSYIYTRLGI